MAASANQAIGVLSDLKKKGEEMLADSPLISSVINDAENSIAEKAKEASGALSDLKNQAQDLVDHAPDVRKVVDTIVNGGSAKCDEKKGCDEVAQISRDVKVTVGTGETSRAS